MMRVILFAACCIAFAFSCGARALAVTEYCPAQMGVFKALDSKGASGVLSYYLRAEGARVASGTLVLKANKGRWFSVPIPESSLTERVYHFQNGESKVSATRYESDVQYVQLPSGVSIEGAYPAQIDGAPCTVPAGLGENEPYHYAGNGSIANPLDARTDLDVAPVSNAPIAAAAEIPVPGSLACAHPFALADAEMVDAPDGDSLDDYRQYPHVTLVALAVSANGKLDDAWIFLSSGSARQDETALKVARNGTYRAGRSFCQPAPGVFLSSYIK